MKSCIVNFHGAQIYCETAGKGVPIVMLHAGIADARQWNNEFAFFAQQYHVIRYDRRGHGQTEPTPGQFNHLKDLEAVLDELQVNQPAVLMGCSNGGGLALDFALEYPDRVRALILVSAGPSGLDLDVPESPKAAQADKAFAAGDIDQAAELEIQMWFDGNGRAPEQVDPTMRKLVYDMDRLALGHQSRQPGQRLPNAPLPAFDRLGDVEIPVLIVVGAHDEPYTLEAADYMLKRIASARKIVVENAAHLPNMDQPQQFRAAVEAFLHGLPA